MSLLTGNAQFRAACPSLPKTHHRTQQGKPCLWSRASQFVEINPHALVCSCDDWQQHRFVLCKCHVRKRFKIRASPSTKTTAANPAVAKTFARHFGCCGLFRRRLFLLLSDRRAERHAGLKPSRTSALHMSGNSDRHAGTRQHKIIIF